jgi:hypothetical protein
MENLIHNGENNYYFKSGDIRVFPSSFRGTYKAGDNTNDPDVTFDPEARLNTEANFILPKAIIGDSSYIIEYNTAQNKIKFVLGGYYFELSNANSYLEDLKDQYIGIKLRSITLLDPVQEGIKVEHQHDSTRKTYLLDSWEENADHVLDIPIGGDYAFTGINVIGSDLSAESITTHAKLKLILSDGSINQAAYLPVISHGAGINSLLHGEGLNADGKNQTVLGQYNSNNPKAIFEVGVGTSASDRKNALEVILDVNDSQTPTVVTRRTKINTDTTITGDTSITGTVNVGGKVTSSATVSGDSSTTLATKGYVDSLIGGINTSAVVPPSGGGGKYITAVSQSGAKISTSDQAFDSSISSSSTHNNAPTTKAVHTFVTDTINGLDVDYQGARGQFIEQIREVNGKIEASPRAFATTFDPDDENATNTVPTVSAIYAYIEQIKGDLTTDFTTTLGTTVGTMQGGATAGSGEFITGVTQSGGSISTSTKKFDTKITSDDNHSNAPTSKAVYTLVNDSIKNILTRTDITTTVTRNKQGKVPADSVEYHILDLIYPVGSIYMHQPDSLPETGPACPIPIGEWELIEAGRFLCAANNSSKGAYSLGNKAGSAETKLRDHSHTVTINSGGATTVTSEGMSANNAGSITIRRMNDSGAYPVTGTSGFITTSTTSGGKHGCIGWGGKTEDRQKVLFNIGHTHNSNIPSHSHTGTVSTVSTSSIDSGDIIGDGNTNNLPPYIAVYIWRRKS